jgi:hypothetical protein
MSPSFFRASDRQTRVCIEKSFNKQINSYVSLDKRKKEEEEDVRKKMPASG